ncbi:hypothetical protein DFH06DRAFT_1226814 [Mycena polygramma]|nr:hypothetical protein DFH06DRAFT_1226814 [Mycena polygramma]
MTGRNLVPEIDEDNPWYGICVDHEHLRDKATESRIADVSATLASGQNSRCRQRELAALVPVHLCTPHVGAPTFRMRSSAHLLPPYARTLLTKEWSGGGGELCCRMALRAALCSRRRAHVFIELRGYTTRATPTARGAVHTGMCLQHAHKRTLRLRSPPTQSPGRTLCSFSYSNDLPALDGVRNRASLR